MPQNSDATVVSAPAPPKEEAPQPPEHPKEQPNVLVKKQVLHSKRLAGPRRQPSPKLQQPPALGVPQNSDATVVSAPAPPKMQAPEPPKEEAPQPSPQQQQQQSEPLQRKLVPREKHQLVRKVHQTGITSAKIQQPPKLQVPQGGPQTPEPVRKQQVMRDKRLMGPRRQVSPKLFEGLQSKESDAAQALPRPQTSETPPKVPEAKVGDDDALQQQQQQQQQQQPQLIQPHEPVKKQQVLHSKRLAAPRRQPALKLQQPPALQIL